MSNKRQRLSDLPFESWFGSVGRQFKGTLLHRMGKGESVDQVDASGMTALMHMCRDGQLEFAKWLLDHGADPNFQNPDQCTALQSAGECSTDEIKVAKLLLEAGADLKLDRGGCETVGLIAIRHGDVPLLSLTLEAGLDPNQAMRHGFSAVEHASMYKSVAVLDLLLQRGGCVDGRKSEHEFSPLMLSLCKKNPIVAEFLLDCGANPLARYWHRDHPDQIFMAADLAQKAAPALYTRIKQMEADWQARVLHDTTIAVYRPRSIRL